MLSLAELCGAALPVDRWIVEACPESDVGPVGPVTKEVFVFPHDAIVSVMITNPSKVIGNNVFAIVWWRQM